MPLLKAANVQIEALPASGQSLSNAGLDTGTTENIKMENSALGGSREYSPCNKCGETHCVCMASQSNHDYKVSNEKGEV
jgi:hypothetical protein